jgi:hypothetical protein
MRHHNQPRSTEPSPVKNNKTTSPRFASKSRATILVLMVLFLLAAALWVGGFWQNLFAGPNIPLPRQSGSLSLGMPESQVLKLYPTVQKKLRPFNNDPLFQIADLAPPDGLESGWSSLSLLFFQGQLYYFSILWDGPAAQTVPLESWIHQYRRWNPRGSQGRPNQMMGDKINLQEWYFNDQKTEMTLRNLDYDAKSQRWQDLRDAANSDAQAAFAKYRLDGDAR